MRCSARPGDQPLKPPPPLVQQAMTAMGIAGYSEVSTEMTSMAEDRGEEDWKPSNKEDVRKSAEKKLSEAAKATTAEAAEAEDDFDPNAEAPAEKAQVSESKQKDTEADIADEKSLSPKEEPEDLLEKEEPDLLGEEIQETSEEVCFDPLQQQSLNVQAVPSSVFDEEDTTALFMANRGGGVAMSPEDLLASLSTPSAPEIPGEAAAAEEPAVVEAAPVEKISAGLTFDEDDLSPSAPEIVAVVAPAAVEAAPIQTISAGFTLDEDDFFATPSA